MEGRECKIKGLGSGIRVCAIWLAPPLSNGMDYNCAHITRSQAKVEGSSSSGAQCCGVGGG